jgi:hypothetical protein
MRFPSRARGRPKRGSAKDGPRKLRSPAKSSATIDSPSLPDRQARKIANKFGLALPIARAVAELAFYGRPI